MEKYPFKKIGERLRNVRGNLSQGKFASILGIKQQQYNRYEMGRITPPINILQKIVDYGKVSIDWILKGEEHGFPEDVMMKDLMDKVDHLGRQGVIPKASISDDEMAIIKALRLLSFKDSIEVLTIVLKKIEADPLISKSEYTERFLNRIMDMIKKGKFEGGIDFEGLFWGYVKVVNYIKSKKKSEI